MKTAETKCTLTNEELIEKATEWVSRLCKSGGADFTMRVPVDFNNDTDMIFSELINRFKNKLIIFPNDETFLKAIEENQNKNNDSQFSSGWDAAISEIKRLNPSVNNGWIDVKDLPKTGESKRLMFWNSYGNYEQIEHYYPGKIMFSGFTYYRELPQPPASDNKETK